MASSYIQNHYPWPFIINVAKLWFNDASSNYEIWKEQMLCLIEGQDLLGFIDGSILPPQPETQQENYLLWRRSDRLLKGWILSSLDETLLSEVVAMTTARDVWLELENKFSQLQLQRQNIDSDSEDRNQVSPTSTEISQNNEEQGKDLMEYAPLYKAALQGDWEAVKRIFDRDPAAITAVLNNNSKTPLHVAAGTEKSIHLVQKMVEMMPDDAIAQRTSYMGSTALHVAAGAGNVGAATILVNRMPNLLYIPNFSKPIALFPLHIAAMFAHKRMVQYLISVTKEQTPYDDFSGLTLLTALIRAEFFDIALDLVNKYPYLAKLSYSDGVSALSLTAENKTVIRGGCCLGFWERFIPIKPTKLEKHMMMNQQVKRLVKLLCKQMGSMSYMEAADISEGAIFAAAKVSNSSIVEMVTEAFPDAIMIKSIDSGRSIFHVAVENRSEAVFNLLYQMENSYKHECVNESDNCGNNLLHEAGKLGPSHKLNQISGAALQMQRELQWYKEVEKLVVPNRKNLLNDDKKTPPMIFTEEHKQLKEEGEKWMKDTSASCTIAAALIATVIFAAAITVPGGNENTTGFPIFSKEIEFIVFGISNAISLFTSTSSLLMFLSIFTSRYAEEDFLYALPKRLIIGLATLFLSVLFMMVAFSVTIYLVFGQKKAWVLIPVAALACLPVTSFVLLQYPLLVDLVSSTYGRGIFGKQSNRPFYG